MQKSRFINQTGLVKADLANERFGDEKLWHREFFKINLGRSL